MLAKIKGGWNISGADLYVWDVSFRERSVRMIDTENVEIIVPYRELVAAYLEVREERTGKPGHPELEEVTEELEGCLVLYDREYRRIRVNPVEKCKKAGAILKQLAVHAPYLFLKYMPWMEEGDVLEFSRIQEMVSVMRSVSRGPGGLI